MKLLLTRSWQRFGFRQHFFGILEHLENKASIDVALFAGAFAFSFDVYEGGAEGLPLDRSPNILGSTGYSRNRICNVIAGWREALI